MFVSKNDQTVNVLVFYYKNLLKIIITSNLNIITPILTQKTKL